ncbi:MAG: type II toxin-antitoxin system RelE/ParE family toxin [Candidatus Scalindua sp.]|jgi:mRNA interferase RelE/StbE|nr:type II toxin-antitoxin system RelE/ParE family toxin [Candidatus Scalindua sp.]MBT5306310.1 type II toxin-antitoxin system RelE/ParE family toxin [Candidatus Scalindua sp.]MBT6050149.1 type II toxin-antitoxin system RelE/ParE family toxin [Candidatus Scalindua sp.]MBT6230507.1 type II toxin-antitoxin system RelE/ParE family toxin [Candidatus Scalindua sp.]MBT6564600.1 type II toxin-antitoxin system RelE/ParE family toxin [Candidatus Scalindua sp.]
MWKVEYTKRFLKELSKLPKDVQTHTEKIVFDELLSTDPFELGYLEHMTGYPDKYKIRIGRYRIGITMDKTQKLLICQRIAHRKDIYRIFP